MDTLTKSIKLAGQNINRTPEAAKILEQQHATWNKFSPGWKKWDHFTMRFLDAQGKAIISELNPGENDHILDIASGTGEPGLTMATMAKHGSVTAVDLSEGMLEIAREKAFAKNIWNFRTIPADACSLPFADASFDAVSNRLGFMFYPDMLQAAKEMLRVVKPGGQIAITVWGEPQQNLWITAMMSTLKKNMDMPTPPADAPGMFRCAAPGMISNLLEEVGFTEIREQVVEGHIHCASNEEYWEFMNDVVPPVVSVLKDAEPAFVNHIKKEVFQLLDEKLPGQEKHVSHGARLIAARRPR